MSRSSKAPEISPLLPEGLVVKKTCPNLEKFILQNKSRVGKNVETEYILRWMSDPLRRRQARKGLLKTEQVHQLARDITYGNRGRFKGKSLEDINGSGNCTAAIIAAITYRQAKEISRIIKEEDSESSRG